MLPTHIAAEAAKGVLGATRAGGDHHRHGPASAPRMGRLGGFPAAPGRLWGSLRPQALARVQAVAWRSGRVGVAHATGKCALVHNISQVWSFEPARLVDLQGLGNTPLGQRAHPCKSAR